MSDLIDRQELRRAMYQEAFEKDSEDQRWDSGCWIRYRMFERVVDSIPSAQPEIIRCKDCKHREVENGFCEGRGWPMQLVPDDGFCDKRERRTDERSD